MSDVFQDDLDEVFGLVADRTRLDILRALWRERIEHDDSEVRVSFSDLRQRVGAADSGRFNYHLDKLVPEFVTQDEGGYHLTYAGTRIIGAGVSGVYQSRDVRFESSTGRECPEIDCTGTTEMAYESGSVTFGCDTCDSQYLLNAPPILVGGHDAAENPDVVRRYALSVIQKTARGFCHLCNGPLSVSVRPEDESTADHDHVILNHECGECGAVSNTSALLQVLDHPAVVAALHEADIDYREAFFEANSSVLDIDEEVTGTDPLRIEVTVETTEMAIRAELDEDLAVADTDRLS